MDKETQKMFDILHENKRRQQIISRPVKSNKLKNVIIAILLIFVVIVLAMLIYNMDKDFVNKCVANGVSEYACKKAQ